MRLFFGARNSELETKNRILTDAARKRAERIEELERRVDYLKQELDAQRARLLNEKDEELAGMREVLAQRGRLLNEKDEELAGMREVLAQRGRLLNGKDEELADLREVLTQRSLRIQELENALSKLRGQHSVPHRTR